MLLTGMHKFLTGMHCCKSADEHPSQRHMKSNTHCARFTKKGKFLRDSTVPMGVEFSVGDILTSHKFSTSHFLSDLHNLPSAAQITIRIRPDAFLGRKIMAYIPVI